MVFADWVHDVDYLFLWSMVTALGICAAIWAVVQYTVMILFTPTKLTRLSPVPFCWLALMLVSMMLECSLLGWKFDVICNKLREPLEKYFDCTVDNNQTLPSLFWLNRLIKVYLFSVFVLTYTYELFSVMLMLWFQDKLELT